MRCSHQSDNLLCGNQRLTTKRVGFRGHRPEVDVSYSVPVFLTSYYGRNTKSWFSCLGVAQDGVRDSQTRRSYATWPGDSYGDEELELNRHCALDFDWPGVSKEQTNSQPQFLTGWLKKGRRLQIGTHPHPHPDSHPTPMVGHVRTAKGAVPKGGGCYYNLLKVGTLLRPLGPFYCPDWAL